ncbi:MAG: DUF1638 domain-containing protein [Desulfobacterales bacterium]|nr:DUF1638 domain-containing protein [Desulfobacterales bacterium]
MHYVIIACEVMRPELELLSKEARHVPKIFYLRQGLHDTPKILQKEVQEAIHRVENEFPNLTHIVLGYGLCGQGLSGVKSTRCEIIIPRVHDCIPLLIGSRDTYQKQMDKACGTYWFSPGWLTYSVIPYVEGRDERMNSYVEKYGQEKAAMIMGMEEALLSNYTRACLITWSAFGDAWMEKSKEYSARSNLPLETLKGNPLYLKALLEGPWDTRRFVRIPPTFAIEQSMDEETVMVPQESSIEKST